MGDGMTIGIIFAMKEEVDEFIKHLDNYNEYDLFNLHFYEGVISNNRCFVCECGVGKVNAARCTQILIDNMKCDYIINVGVAGGLSNNLSVGDIVIGEKLVQHDFDITAFNHDKGYVPGVGMYIKSDEYLILKAKEAFDFKKISMHIGTVASGDIFVSDGDMGKKINSKFGALCVEMEGASIAQVCYLSHIPFLVIRCISDIPNGNNVITYDEFLESSCKNAAIFLDNMLKNIEING